MKVKFKGKEYKLVVSSYHNGRKALSLTDNVGIPYMTATVNFPNLELKEDQVAIKNYSENEGIEEALREAGVIGDPIAMVPSGFVMCNICKLLI